jgi:putative NADH-flavin reductase
LFTWRNSLLRRDLLAKAQETHQSIADEGEHMKITILGITGGTGGELSKQALARGHEVIGLVRRPETFLQNHPKLRVVQGSVEQEEAMHHVAVGAEVIVCAIGANGFRASMQPTTLYSTAARHMVKAAKKAGVERLVAITSGGVLDDSEAVWWYRRLLKPLLQPLYEDMIRLEAILREASARHLLVRPTYLQNGAATNQYRTRSEKTPANGIRVRRADVAEYMLKRIEADDYQREAVGISQ